MLTRRQALHHATQLAAVSLVPTVGGPPRQPTSRQGVGEPLNLLEYEAHARGTMDPVAWEYFASGNADDITLRWNRDAFERMGLRPRFLGDLSTHQTSIRLFGQDHPYPVLLAPAAYHRVIHPEGELAVARGAVARNTTMVVSSATTTAIEDVAKATTGPLWFQLYLDRDRGFSEEQVRRAVAAGCRVLCVTVDSPTYGPRNRPERVQFDLPKGLVTPHFRLGQSQYGSSGNPVTWSDLDWLRSITSLPIVLKGILHPQDAAEAIQRRVDGIIVSNHGGRNLDTSLATLDALPDVVRAVDGRCPVLMDGGIRRGTDVVKALALGASAVLIGRPYLYGLCVAGAAGVSRVLEILHREVTMALALTGQVDPARVSAEILWRPPRC